VAVEVPFCSQRRLGGLVGVKSLSIAVIVATFLALLYLCYKISGNFKASIAACAVCTFFATVNFGPRTILFGYLYLVVLLIILERFRRLGRAPLWLIPVLLPCGSTPHGSCSGADCLQRHNSAGLYKEAGVKLAERWAPSVGQARAYLGGQHCRSLCKSNRSPSCFLSFDLAFRRLNIATLPNGCLGDFHNLRWEKLLGGLCFAGRLCASSAVDTDGMASLLFGLYSGLTYIRFRSCWAMAAP
jgi:hypothetical protein